MNNNSEGTKISRREREFQARRKEILEAATRLFARKGYHGATMSEIAKEAEFSTGSLYNFFQNKEELYFQLLLERIDLLEGQVEEVMQRKGDVEQRLRDFVATTLGFFEADRDFFRIFVEQRGQFALSAKGQFHDVIHEKYENYLGNMVSLMQQGVDEGIFKVIQPAELALYFLGIVNTILFMFVNSEEPYELQKKGEMILDIFFEGTRKREVKE